VDDQSLLAIKLLLGGKARLFEITGVLIAANASEYIVAEGSSVTLLSSL
jgi:hypothetical protein